MKMETKARLGTPTIRTEGTRLVYKASRESPTIFPTLVPFDIHSPAHRRKMTNKTHAQEAQGQRIRDEEESTRV